MSYNSHRPVNHCYTRDTDPSAHQVRAAQPPEQGYAKSQSNDNVATPSLPQKPSQGMRYIRQNTDHQDVHIRTASSSSATASNPENVIQKILSHAYPDLPPICSRAQSLISIPATMSDYGTESDEESSSDNDAPSPSSAEHDFFNPVRQAKRVIILDRPPRNFDATHAPQQMGHLCETGTQDCRPNPSVGAEISDKAANLSLDELYGKGLTSYPHQTVIEVEHAVWAVPRAAGGSRLGLRRGLAHGHAGLAKERRWHVDGLAGEGRRGEGHGAGRHCTSNTKVSCGLGLGVTSET